MISKTKAQEEAYLKKYNIPPTVPHDAHKRAVILAIMRQDGLTPRKMADRLGVRLSDFQRYTAQQEPYNGPVSTMVERYLSVPIVKWRQKA